MKPALSIILFTTIAGAAQGMVVALALATLAGIAPATALAPMLWAATGMLLVALVASFFHLGHPLRAWRTVLMWRTSWMSREVIVLPAFIALVGGWALLATLAQRDAVAPHWLAGKASRCRIRRPSRPPTRPSTRSRTSSRATSTSMRSPR